MLVGMLYVYAGIFMIPDPRDLAFYSEPRTINNQILISHLARYLAQNLET